MKVFEKSKYLKIEKIHAHKFLRQLKKKFENIIVLDNKRLILYEENYVYFPINISKIKKRDIKKTLEMNFKLIKKKPLLNPNYRPKDLKEALVEKFPRKVLKSIPNSYDIIGTIAILEFDKFKAKDINIKKQVAETLVCINNSISTVYEKESIVKGIYRLRELKLLSGDDNSETIHKENGCQFYLDVKKTYFSPRLVYERKRISTKLFREQEMIIDMFAGVGTFSIQIAKLNNVDINGFDINPEACNFFEKNIKVNKLIGNIKVHNLDVKKLLNPQNELGNTLKASADRIIMNLPEKSLEFIDVACFLIKNEGGIIHIYRFSDKPESIEKCIIEVKQELKKWNWGIEEVINAKIVKPFSPKSDLVVADLKVFPIPKN